MIRFKKGEREYAKLNVTITPKLVKIGFMGFFSDDSDIAAVDDSTGVVTGLKPGTTSILMDVSGDYQHDPFVVDKYCKVTVVEKGSSNEKNGSSDKKEELSIAKAKVTGIKSKTWTGRALKQRPVVKLSGKTLRDSRQRRNIMSRCAPV